MIMMIMIPHESYYDNYFTIENDNIYDTNVNSDKKIQLMIL